jgi:hypothetical protein
MEASSDPSIAGRPPGVIGLGAMGMRAWPARCAAPVATWTWQRLALRLTADDRETISRKAADRGLAGAGVR